MPLLLAESVVQYCNLYRVVHVGGRFGGSKTSLAFRIAYEMVQRGWYRYIVSNTKSVWCENFDDVKLRDGIYCDCIIILDEGGLFLKTGTDAETFLAYLRKLNICLLIPSVSAPATKLRTLTLQRLMNFAVFGIPALLYGWELSSGSIKEKGKFVWWNPSEVHGIYDTLDTPSDDAGLSDYMVKWVDMVRSVRSQNDNKSSQQYSKDASRSGDETDLAFACSILAEVRGTAGELRDIQEEVSRELSTLGEQRKRRRR